MEQIVNEYYKNNAQKLHNVVDKVLYCLRFKDIDKEDFYSLANEVFVQTIQNYNESESFDGFLYSCLYKKFCTEMTKRNRQKRKNIISIISKDSDGNDIITEKIIPDDYLDRSITSNHHMKPVDVTLGETIPSKFDVESEVFGEKEDFYSSKMMLYLSRLSVLQKEVLDLITIGYTVNEIITKLHITEQQYNDCYNAIHSYRNTSVLI